MLEQPLTSWLTLQPENNRFGFCASESDIVAPNPPLSGKHQTVSSALMPSDIEAIHKEIEALSRAIARLGTLRVAALLVLTVTFVQAFQRLEASRSQIESLRSTMDQQRHIIEREFQHLRLVVLPPTFSPYQSPLVPTSDCRLLDKLRQKQAYARGSTLALAAEGWVDACKELSEVYHQAFLLKVPLNRSDVEVDLRRWVFWAPVVFVIAELYLAILRKKRSLLSRFALPTDTNETRELSISDRLFLSPKSGEEAPFVQYPYQYLRSLDEILCCGLGAFLLFASRPVWQGLNGETIRFLLLFYGTVAFYAAAYYLHVASRLNAAVRRAFGYMQSEPWRHRLWQSWKDLGSRARKRLGFSIPITLGSLLLLLTLILPISIISCNDALRHPQDYQGKLMPFSTVTRGESGLSPAFINFGRGYKLFLGQSLWPPAFYMGADPGPVLGHPVPYDESRSVPPASRARDRVSERVGTLGYRILLALAAAGPLTLIRRLRLKLAQLPRNFFALTYILSCTILLFSLTDMAFAWISSWFSLPVYWLMPVVWSTGLLAALGSTVVTSQHIRRRLATMTTAAAIVYAPVPLFAAAFLIPWHSVRFMASFSLYVAGAALLALGYSALLQKMQTRT